MNHRIAENRLALRTWYVKSEHKDNRVTIRNDISTKPQKAQENAETFKRNIIWAHSMLKDNIPFSYRMELLHHIVRWSDFIKEVQALDKT